MRSFVQQSRLIGASIAAGLLMAGCSGGSSSIPSSAAAASAAQPSTLKSQIAIAPLPSATPAPLPLSAYALVASIWVDADDLPGRLDLYEETKHRDDDHRACSLAPSWKWGYRPHKDIAGPLHAYAFPVPSPCAHHGDGDDDDAAAATLHSDVAIGGSPSPSPTPTATPDNGLYLIAVEWPCAAKHDCDRDDIDPATVSVVEIAGPGTINDEKVDFVPSASQFQFNAGTRYHLFLAKHIATPNI